MSRAQTKFPAALCAAVIGWAFFYLPATYCWASANSFARGHDSHVYLNNVERTTSPEDQVRDAKALPCSIFSATVEIDDLAVVAESLSESLKLHFSTCRPNASSLTAHEKALGQPATDYDWVFMPEACSAQANRGHAPPASA